MIHAVDLEVIFSDMSTAAFLCVRDMVTRGAITRLISKPVLRHRSSLLRCFLVDNVDDVERRCFTGTDYVLSVIGRYLQQ